MRLPAFFRFYGYVRDLGFPHYDALIWSLANMYARWTTRIRKVL